MSVKLKLELTDEQALALIQMAATKHWSVEDHVMYLIEVGLAESGHYPMASLDDLFKELSDESDQ